MTESRFGRFHVGSRDDVPVATVGTWTLTYICGPTPIAAGGSVLFVLPLCGWSSPKLFPTAGTNGGVMDNSVTGLVFAAATGDDAVVSLSRDVTWHRLRAPDGERLWLWRGSPVEAVIDAGELHEGDLLVLTYGDPTSGSVGAVSGTHAGIHEFSAYVDPDGRREGPCGGFFPLSDGQTGGTTHIRCLPREPRKLVVTAPSRVVTAEPFDLGVVPRDEYGNAQVDEERQLTLAGTSWDVLVARGPVIGGEGDMRIRGAARIKTAGVHRIIVRDSPPGLEGVSNPIEVIASEPEYRLFWGDLHAHTHKSDGLGTPRDAYLYARDVAMVDFAALTDHDSMLTEASWDEIRDAAGRSNEPGRFITFSGYEYKDSRYGCHKTVYYLHDNRQLYRGQDEAYDRLEKLYDVLRGTDAILMAHVGIGQEPNTLWACHEPELQRLAEVYSCRGSSEHPDCPRALTNNHQYETWEPSPGCSAQDGFASGCRVALVCASDSHSGQPGCGNLSGSFGRRRAYHGGLTAVLAPELTREAVWDALYNRRCYGTTGPRIIMHLEIDGELMGAELRRQAGSRLQLHAYAIGTDRIDAFELVRNNAALFAIRSDSERAEIDETIIVPEQGCDHYYVRVMQADGEMGWAGPIWVEPAQDVSQ